MLKRISQRQFLIGLTIMLLGILGSIEILIRNDSSTMELPNAYLNFNMISLYLQPTIFFLFFKQILIFRSARFFIGIRKKQSG